MDLTHLTPHEFTIFQAGYLSGLLEGIDRGRDKADAEAAALHHRAFLTVQAAAKQPTHEELERIRRRPLLDRILRRQA